MKNDVRIDELLDHGPWLERLARKLVQDPESAEDALQNTWLSAMRAPPRSRDAQRSWLRTVLLREVFLRHRRDERRRRHEALVPRESESAGDPAADAESKELRADLARLVRELSEPYRSTLELRFFHDLSPTEIAARLGVPAATVRWRAMEGLSRLRAELRRRHQGRALGLVLLPLTRDRGTAARSDSPSSPIAEWSARRPLSRAKLGLSAAALLLVGALVAFWLTNSSLEASGAELAVAEVGADSQGVAKLREIDARAARSTVELSERGASGVLEHDLAGARRAPELDVDVLDARGNARTDASVLVFRSGPSEFVAIARTDEAGRARVRLEPEDVGAWGGKGAKGRVALRASAPGWAHSEVVFASARDERPPVRIVLSATESIVEGELVDERGRPVAGGVVEVGYVQSQQLFGAAASDPTLPHPVRATTDELGKFRAERVDGSAGRVAILATHADFLPGFLEQIVDGASERACVITLSEGGRVRGRAVDTTGAPVAGARIWHEPAEQGGDAAVRSRGYVRRLRGWSRSTLADDAGRFDLETAPVGETILWAQDPARPELVAYEAVEIGRDATFEWTPVLASSNPLEVVVDGAGPERSGWIVRLWIACPGDKRCIREEETDAEGRARFFDVVSSSIDVSVFAPDTGFLAARTSIQGVPEQPLEILLGAPASVSGRVVTSDGAPFADGSLRVVPTGGLALWTVLPHDPASGAFDQVLPPGSYALIASLRESNAPVASFELQVAEHRELGEIRLPALAILRIEDSLAAPSRGLEYRIRQSGPPLPRGLNPRVETGAWPPPAERKLLPGSYVLEIGSFLARELSVEREWPIELAAGGAVVLRVSL